MTNVTNIVFRPEELEALQTIPEALVALAEYHDGQAAMAGGIGDYKECRRFHEDRAKKLRDAAEILRRWENDE